MVEFSKGEISSTWKSVISDCKFNFEVHFCPNQIPVGFPKRGLLPNIFQVVKRKICFVPIVRTSQKGRSDFSNNVEMFHPRLLQKSVRDYVRCEDRLMICELWMVVRLIRFDRVKRDLDSWTRQILIRARDKNICSRCRFKKGL